VRRSHGIIPYLPVNEGEIAIVGMQNSPGTTLMTIADMSVITAEVKVDETDIVNLKVGQEAHIKVDALGDRLLPGHVSEIGNSALSRTGGAISSTTTNNQEAKDFKVVVTLDNPPRSYDRPVVHTRPSSPRRRKTGDHRADTQASRCVNSMRHAADNRQHRFKKKKVEHEGVFVLKNGAATFPPRQDGHRRARPDIEIWTACAK
jgi:hypothetical protein